MSSSSPPVHLSSVACDAWVRVEAECVAAKLATETKYDVLERYAVAYEQWLICQQAVREEGQTVQSISDTTLSTQRNPRMVDFHALTKLIGHLRSELGLTPASSSSRRDNDEPIPTDPPRRKIKILRTG